MADPTGRPHQRQAAAPGGVGEPRTARAREELQSWLGRHTPLLPAVRAPRRPFGVPTSQCKRGLLYGPTVTRVVVTASGPGAVERASLRPCPRWVEDLLRRRRGDADRRSAW